MTDIWAEKPGFDIVSLLWDDKTADSAAKVYNADLMDAFHEKLKAKITQIHECLGEYESKEWCGHCIVDSKCAQITMHIIELKKKADTLTFLFGKKGVKTENLMKIQMWREKAERWDQYAIYDNDNEPKILVKDLITAYEKLEAVKTWLIKAKAEGRVSMNIGFSLGLVLGIEK